VERSETPVSSGMIQGKVTVFGRIYTICPHGSQAVVATMKRLNDEFGSTGRFHLVAMAPTTDRETPSFFRSFANLAGTSESDPWWFVSMETNALSRFATTGLGLNPPRPIPEEERLNPLEDHEYDLRLVLVDADGKIRGRYEVFHADWAKGDAAAHQLETDTRHLLALP
jgi:cytochrome oxidase Cu insertion factor (SCO1/SenC/PrrC family)